MHAIKTTDAWLKFNIHFIEKRMTMRRYLIQSYQKLFESTLRKSDAVSSSSDFWALRGISMSVGEGEVVGLLGHNGAGKTTLLMTLAGIYCPDKGRVETQGKIGTLLSLGAGFNGELTGWENIVINGVFLGFTPKEINEKINSIIEFSELGKFINAPMKTYSSGMRARLGFSIAITINPDILLIDEVFEAGDEAFKKKSGNLIQHYKESGKTIVMASHNLNMLRTYCNRAVLLDHGEIAADGPTQEIVEFYSEQVRKKKEEARSGKANY